MSIPAKHMMPRAHGTDVTVRGWDTLFILHVGGSTASLCKAEASWLRDRINEWLDGQKKPSPDFRSLKLGDTVRFDEGNSLLYYQDMAWHTGVPHGVTFLVDDIDKPGVCLVAPGYGGKPYGNGKILVYFDQEQVTPRYRDDGAWRL